MAYAPESVSLDRGDGSILGSFVEQEFGHFFEFSKNPELFLSPPAHGGKNTEFPHFVWVTHNPINGWACRRALVKKTVAHVIVDITEDGSNVVEKWDIKNLRSYI